MTAKDRILELCYDKHIAISRLEKDLNFSNGYIKKNKSGDYPADRLKLIADYLNVSLEYLMFGKTGDDEQPTYYDERTYEIAQKIYDNDELRLLFDVAVDTDPELLQATHNLLLTMKRRERKNDNT